MTSLGVRRPSLSLLAMLVSALLVVANASASAERIQVLLVIPTESGKLARQVSRFEDELRRSTGRVVRAHSLADADAVVQFTIYRRSVNDKGVSQDWWYGQYKLLKPPRQGAGGERSAQRFAFVVSDCEDWQVQPAVGLLGVTLARALGLTPYSAKGESL